MVNDLIIYVHIESFNEFEHAEFIEQLKIYNKLANVILVDNSANTNATDAFLQKLENEPLDNVSYIINDAKESYSVSANKGLSGHTEHVLFVSPRVRIDEESILALKQVADISEHHGFVMPRTDAGHFQAFPHSKCLFGNVSNVGSSKMAYESVRESLPEYHIVPACFDECVLVDYARLCNTTRMNEEFQGMGMALSLWSLVQGYYGYNTVCANRAYATGALCINNEQNAHDASLFEKNGRVLLNESVNVYMKALVNANVYFEELTASSILSDRKRLLFYIPGLNGLKCGSWIHATCLLEGLLKALPEHIDVCIAGSEEGLRAYGYFERFKDNTRVSVCDENSINGLYDIGFVSMFIQEMRHQQILCKHCMKIVVWPLDLIINRSTYLRDDDVLRRREFVARYADGFIYSTNDVKEDFDVYYRRLTNLSNAEHLVTHIVPPDITMGEDISLPFNDYYLIFGNNLLHKMIDQILSVICGITSCNFIVVGGKEDGLYADNVYTYVSGSLSDEHVGALYSKCRGLIFPSIYEGFGLPPVQALNLGKNVYLMNNNINHEL